MNKNKIDYSRYQNKFLNELNFSKEEISRYGANSYPVYLRAPYEFFEFKVKSIVSNNTKILDLCCGNGKHSITAAKCGGKVLGLDIVESSILIARQKAKLNNVEKNTHFQVVDINKLDFDDNSFDLVTCLGSLSYIDIDVFISEVKRVLKENGKLIIVDSLDNNFIYKFNRFLQVILNKRSYSTFNRMPNLNTINKIKSEFSNSEVRYFNLFAWTVPLLKLILKPIQIKKILNYLDNKFSY